MSNSDDLPVWASQLQGFFLILAAIYLRLRKFFSDDSFELKGLRTAIFTLMLPASLLRSSWTKSMSREVAPLVFWSALIQIFWVGLSWLSVNALSKRGMLPRAATTGWYLLTANGVSLGLSLAVLDHPAWGNLALSAAVVYGLGGNEWVCSVGLAFLSRMGAVSQIPGAGGQSSLTQAESSSAARAPSMEMTPSGLPGMACTGVRTGRISRRSTISLEIVDLQHDGEITPDSARTGSFLKQVLKQMLTSPIILALLLGLSMNLSSVPMPLLLNNACEKLSHSFACMIYFLIGLTVDTNPPTLSALCPVLVALMLRFALQLSVILMVPLLLMRLLEVDFMLRRAFMMCILGPSPGLVMFFSVEHSHPQELSALYMTMSNALAFVTLNAASVLLA